MARFGPSLGASQSGASMYDIRPGQALCPYHYEYGEEEWLLLIAGTPTLRDPDGEHDLEPHDLVFFERGPRGAHGITNRTTEPVRVLMFSPVVYPAATVYPDFDGEA
jgi:uncharacterized cupin superfamily protein